MLYSSDALQSGRHAISSSAGKDRIGVFDAFCGIAPVGRAYQTWVVVPNGPTTRYGAVLWSPDFVCFQSPGLRHGAIMPRLTAPEGRGSIKNHAKGLLFTA